MTFAIDVHHTTLSTFVHMSHVTHIMLRVSGVLSYTCLMQQKVAPLTLRRFPVTIHRRLSLVLSPTDGLTGRGPCPVLKAP